MPPPHSHGYKGFTSRLKLLISKNPRLIETTLGNIFTMRLIGNKTHGDLAEIAIAEFINQYMYDFKSVHVGKDLYRAKSHEEDIKIIDEMTQTEFPVSLKAYGDGPLQLSTDKESSLFPLLEKEGSTVIKAAKAQKILKKPEFQNLARINILPLIYNEATQKCNILVFDYDRAFAETRRIERIEHSDRGRRMHPVYRFYDEKNGYICEVRYGGATANALQRGFWTNTKRGINFFDSLTNGWIDYSHNEVLVKLFSHALVSSQTGHSAALKEVKKDISKLKRIIKK